MTARVPRWLVAAAILPWAVVAALIADVLLSAPHHNAPSMIVAGIYGRGGAYGQLAMDPQGTNAFLTVAHMPPLPPGRTYVCWLERNGRMERAGWFHLRGHDGEATALLRAAYPLNSYTLIAISIETRRDAARPSGTLLAAGKI